jgi:1,4-dihydroxy-2-naphthoyl-CoA hydrolase
VNEPSTLGGDGPGEAIGLTYEQIGPELVRASVPVTPPIKQPAGLVHGGIYSLIAESITSYATARVVMEEGNMSMGQSNAATFLRPVTEGKVHATARRRHAGRTTWIWDVEFTDDEQRLCAMVRMTIAIRPRPEE